MSHTRVHIHTQTHSHTQALIHPVLARFFWSSANPDPHRMIMSPYKYCNGTFVTKRDHGFSFHEEDTDLGNIVFLDFAGSGLVHLCGK